MALQGRSGCVYGMTGSPSLRAASGWQIGRRVFAMHVEGDALTGNQLPAGLGVARARCAGGER